MIVMLTRWADDVLGGTGGSSRGFRTWGSFPPCILRRVRVSPGLSARVPPGRLLSDLMLRLLASLSPFVALRFLPLPCVRFSPLRSSSLSRGVSPPFAFSASFPFLPFPSPSLRPVLSSSLHFVPHTASRFVLIPLPRVSPRDSSSASVLVFPVAGSVSLFLNFLSASSSFLPLPSPSFRPVLSGSLHSRPLRSPAVFPPTRRSDSFPVLLPDPGFRRPFFGARLLWPAGRAEAPPHHSTGAAKVTGMVQTLKSLLYPSFEASQSTGNGGLMVLTSCENQALWSCLRRSIRRLRRSSSDAVSDDSSARLAKTPASIK